MHPDSMEPDPEESLAYDERLKLKINQLLWENAPGDITLDEAEQRAIHCLDILTGGRAVEDQLRRVREWETGSPTVCSNCATPLSRSPGDQHIDHGVHRFCNDTCYEEWHQEIVARSVLKHDPQPEPPE